MKEKTPELGPTGRVLRLLCDISGWSAGILLILMATMTVISVIGRAWIDSPIEGDVKLVQLGIAVCISVLAVMAWRVAAGGYAVGRRRL